MKGVIDEKDRPNVSMLLGGLIFQIVLDLNDCWHSREWNICDFNEWIDIGSDEG